MGEDYDIVIPEQLVQSRALAEDVEINAAQIEKKVNQAATDYDPSNRTYSVYVNSDESKQALSQSALETLAVSPQSNLENTLSIIELARQYANQDDLIGLTMESVDNNVNTSYQLKWKDARKKEYDKKSIALAKQVIADFNTKINLEGIIPKVVSSVFRDGNFLMYLRVDENGKKTPAENDYTVDYYPLGLAQISNYDVGGDPYLIIDITELKARLQKTYEKNKKRKPLFFENMEEEIKTTFPDEVYQAYKNKEKYAKLDLRYSGAVRINTQNKQYGLTPIFRALFPTFMLETFAKADRMTASARSKKIIAQFMNKELLGESFERTAKDTYKEQAYAHENLMKAWKQTIVAVTPPPTVRDIRYIEPKATMTDIQMVNYYRLKVMSTLGIAFLADNGGTSFGSASISVKQLMKMINKITRQFEHVLYKWYRIVLMANQIDPMYAPDVSVVDSEMMEMNMRLDLARFLFGTLNCSRESVFDLIGLSLEDEKAKRESENDLNLDEVFTPRITAYTNSGASATPSDGGENKGGRQPAKESTDPDKQAYDKAKNSTGDA